MEFYKELKERTFLGVAPVQLWTSYYEHQDIALPRILNRWRTFMKEG